MVSISSTSSSSSDDSYLTDMILLGYETFIRSLVLEVLDSELESESESEPEQVELEEGEAQSSRKRKIKTTTNSTKTQNKREKTTNLKNTETKRDQTQMQKISKRNNNGGKEATDINWPQKAWEILSKVRQNALLIQCIPSWVSMDLVADTLLAVGASPPMVNSADEIPDFTPQVHTLVINVGGLTATSLPAMKSAAVFAARYRKPWVLDLVVAGCSGFRLRACLELVELRPTVIRGNGSEIIALCKGVDSLHESVDALAAARSLAQRSGAVIAVSRAVDIITDGHKVIYVHNGVPMMQKITSTGCSISALIAAFVAVASHAFEATTSALSVFGIAGELGMGTAKCPASLHVKLIDSLYGLDEATIHHHAKVSPLS